MAPPSTRRHRRDDSVEVVIRRRWRAGMSAVAAAPSPRRGSRFDGGLVGLDGARRPWARPPAASAAAAASAFDKEHRPSPPCGYGRVKP